MLTYRTKQQLNCIEWLTAIRFEFHKSYQKYIVVLKSDGC